VAVEVANSETRQKSASQMSSTQQLPPSSQNTMTIRMWNLVVLRTTTAALKVLAVDLSSQIGEPHSFREVDLKEEEVASAALAEMMISHPINHHRRSMERLPINRSTRDGAEAVDISTSSNKTPGTTSLVTNNKKLVNSTSPAIQTTIVVVDVAVAVSNKPPVSETTATVSILRDRSAKATDKSSLLTKAAKGSSCHRSVEANAVVAAAWAAA